MIADVAGKTVEIQVRTELQHMWAELSEKCADIFGSEVKYGGGDQAIRQHLEFLSNLVAEYEDIEIEIAQLTDTDRLAAMEEKIVSIRKRIAEELEKELSFLDRIGGV